MISYNSLFCLCTETWLQGCNCKQLRPGIDCIDISILIINSWYKKDDNWDYSIVKYLNRILLHRFQVLMAIRRIMENFWFTISSFSINPCCTTRKYLYVFSFYYYYSSYKNHWYNLSCTRYAIILSLSLTTFSRLLFWCLRN